MEVEKKRGATPEPNRPLSLQVAQRGTAVSFIQFFGSALQVTPHFHSLVPDGVSVPREGGVHFERLAPPTQGEVERLLVEAAGIEPAAWHAQRGARPCWPRGSGD